jgi:hypothetical protein
LHSTIRTTGLFVILGGTLFAVPALAACDHPYFPMKQGAKYVYAQAGSALQVTEVVSKVDGNHVTYDVTTSGTATPSSTRVVTGECSPTGFTIDRSTTSRPGSTVKVLSTSGSEFGSPEQMKVGASWFSARSIESQSTKRTVRTDTKSTSKVVASERVRVPAGEYLALKVESHVEVVNTLVAAPGAKGPEMPVIKGMVTTWLVKGVGLVKSQSGGDGDELSPALELVSFTK